MPEREGFRGYLDTVAAQIRWKRARGVVTLELEQHLEDQQEAFAAEGVSADEAERLTLLGMGDAVAVVRSWIVPIGQGPAGGCWDWWACPAVCGFGGRCGRSPLMVIGSKAFCF